MMMLNLLKIYKNAKGANYYEDVLLFDISLINKWSKYGFSYLLAN